MPKVVPEYKEQARLRIIEAGISVFNERGYYRTKMEDIAEHLGVSKGALYQYFKSKEQLFIEVIESLLEARKDEIMNIILSDDPLFISTGDFFEMKVVRSLKTRSFGFDLFLEANRNEALRLRMTKLYEKSYIEFSKHIEDLKDKGVIKKESDVGIVWRSLIALRDGLITSILLGADIATAKKTWEFATTILLGGIFQNM